MKKYFLVLFLSFLMNVTFSANENQDIIYQVSTLQALMEGRYEGAASIKDLKDHGNFGIGTFEALDGEMIFLDDKFYQVKSDGKVYSVEDSVKTPFSVVTYFEADKTIFLKEKEDIKEIFHAIEKELPTKNIFYAIKITGIFEKVKTRSVPKQSKPYPVLLEVTKNQPVFDLQNQEGVITGYWLPDYAKGINLNGFHFHFISKDKKSGGHLLDCILKEGKAEIDFSDNLFLMLPDKTEFYETDLTKDMQKEIEAAEK